MLCFILYVCDLQMVLMEDGGEKLLVTDRDPEGLNNIVESSQILEASHVKEVSDKQHKHLKTYVHYIDPCINDG